MIYRLLAAWFRRDLERLRFPNQTAEGQVLFRRVFDTVRDGALQGFAGGGEAKLLATAAALPWHLRPFLHEGHAIGHAGRHAVALRRRNPEAPMQDDANQNIRFLSYGYWIAIAERYPLPSWGLDGGRWRDEPGHRRYRSLMINGIGFGRALLAGDFDRRMARSLERAFRGPELWMALHGVGRVLWFLNLGNPPTLRSLLEIHRAHAEPLAVGLGVAITYTQVTRPEAIRRTLAALPEELQPWLRSGAGIALRFHAINDPEAEAAVEASLDPMLEPWYAAARDASLTPCSVEDTADWVFHRLPVQTRAAAEQPMGLAT
jgi:hypothetical protein